MKAPHNRALKPLLDEIERLHGKAEEVNVKKNGQVAIHWTVDGRRLTHLTHFRSLSVGGVTNATHQLRRAVNSPQAQSFAEPAPRA